MKKMYYAYQLKGFVCDYTCNQCIYMVVNEKTANG